MDSNREFPKVGQLLIEPAPEDPVPRTGCAVCAACFGQWKTATSHQSPAYDPSFATDLAIGISRHPHPRPVLSVRRTPR
jgi:hypothetical protein